MLLLVTVISLVLGISGEMSKMSYSAQPPSPISMSKPEPEMKVPKEYLKMRHHHVVSRDHGCVEFPEEVEKTFHCKDIWIKNRYSAAGIMPRVVTLEFQYNGMKAMKAAWRPVTTWVENITPWSIRGCAAIPGGMGGALGKGKLRWLTLYNHTQSSVEQSGVIKWTSSVKGSTAGKTCFHANFPQAFNVPPNLKLTYKSNYGMHAAYDATIIWLKGVTTTGVEICMSEFNKWAGYHYNYDIHWYGVTQLPNHDQGSQMGKVIFPAGELYPPDHNRLNYFYCKNVTLPYGYYPCPAVMVQAVEPSLAVCESPLVAWISHWKNNSFTVCYADQRGIMGQRKTDIEVHYIIYGAKDKCSDMTCPMNKQCIHPTWETVACGCWKECPDGGEKVCGTNMKTYKNKCHLEKEACEKNNSFSYAHNGHCENMTMDHGREKLESVSGCGGLYCKVISTRNNIWYPHAKVHVQIAVNWMNEMTGMQMVHDATSSWIEDVKSTSFKACVMEAGRKDLTKAPHINWFAYQGKMKHVMSHRIEVGEWRSGTHCVPIHERKAKAKPIPWHPPKCPQVVVTNSNKVNVDKWQYDSHLMSQIYGQHHHEWFKRMLMGYGVKKMNLTSGMKLKGATLMMTVEHTERMPVAMSYKDAVNVWMEFDNTTMESYVCLREMQNFDGKHKGIHVHWTFFNSSMIPGFGFSYHIKFKPHYFAPMYSNYAFCETKNYLPRNFSLVNSATILLSLHHKIPAHAAYKSMKEYQLHHQEVMRGVPMGDNDFNQQKVVQSWMMPHMWRANLTGWRPHMRISRNTDYSAWIEGMNRTHVKVCQKSIFSGYHYEGVAVSLFVIPDRCPEHYRLWKNAICGKFMDDCANHSTAGQKCSMEQAFVGAPEDIRDNYWISYVAGQRPIQLAKSDMRNEGVWVRDLGNPSKSNFSRWAPGNPTGGADRHCSLQGGRANNFSETDVKCSDCMNFVCMKPAPFLSCKFPSYCNDCGKCTQSAPFKYKCECIPPYTGARCEIKMKLK